MRHVRVFISSPFDVAVERARIQRVIERMNGEFAEAVRFESIRWETEFYTAERDFQPQIPKSEDCDIVIGVFWGRLGIPLPESFEPMPDSFARAPGEPYPSGSGYEILSALHACETRQPDDEPIPDVYIFRKTTMPSVPVDPAKMAEALDQWERLNGFFRRWFRNEQGHFLRAFHEFQSVDDFEENIADLLRTWTRKNVQGAGSLIWPATKGSPFRGLDAFDADQAAVFFGRDRKIARAIETLKQASGWTGGAEQLEPLPDDGKVDPRTRSARPFLLIVGPSGAGKSSLMRAGILPRLTAPGVVSDVGMWRTVTMRPSERETAFLALASVLVSSSGDNKPEEGLPELAQQLRRKPGERLAGEALIRSLAELLEKHPVGAASAVVKALDQAGETGDAVHGLQRRLSAHLLICVDQLDDIFSSEVDADQRARFAVTLAELTRTRRVWVVATLRGDLYVQMISERNWLALKDSGGTYDLAPPGEEELEEIVRKPAAAAGLVYETDPWTRKRLDERLLADAAGGDVLPLLQFTLNALFEKRETRDDQTFLTFAAYEDLGGLEGAIEHAAETAIGKLAPEDIERLPRFLRQLVVRVTGEGDLTVRAVPRETAMSDAASRRLVTALVEARILSTDKEGKAGAAVRIAHERVLRRWSRASEIIRSQRDFYRIHDDVMQQYRRWFEGGMRSDLLLAPGSATYDSEKMLRNYRDELDADVVKFIERSGRRARRRFRALVALNALLLVMVIGTGVASYAAMQNYNLARATIDDLIQSFTTSLSDVRGIPLDTLTLAYSKLEPPVNELGAQVWVPDRTFGLTPANLDFAFADMYRKLDKIPGSDTQSLALAEKSFKRREDLLKRFPNDGKISWSVSLSYEQIGDILRAQGKPVEAIGQFLPAAAIRDAHFRARPEDLEKVKGYFEIYTRLGDTEREVGQLLIKQGKGKAAPQHFKKADDYHHQIFPVALSLHLQAPDEPKYQEELAWSLNKQGTERMARKPTDIAGAMQLFASELCLRRRVLESRPIDARFENDVSWALDRLGTAQELAGDLDGAERSYFEAWTIRYGLAKVDSSNTLLSNDLALIDAHRGALAILRKDRNLAFNLLNAAQTRKDELEKKNQLRAHLRSYDIRKKIKEAADLPDDQVASSGYSFDAIWEDSRQELQARPRTSAECWGETSRQLKALLEDQEPFTP